MIPIRPIALALFLGLAPASHIVTSAAWAEEQTQPRPSPLSLSPDQAKTELRATRDTLAASLRKIESQFETREAALEAVKAAWATKHMPDSLPPEATSIADELVELWASPAVKKTRDEALSRMLRAMDEAIASGLAPRAGQIDEMRTHAREFGFRLAALAKHMEKDALIPLEKSQALIHLDVQARVVTEKEREDLEKKFDDQRSANREALGTARFSWNLGASLSEAGERFSTELPSLGEEPSGTRLEVLYWRFVERAAGLRRDAVRRVELEKEIDALHRNRDREEVGSINPWTRLDELRALDRRMAKGALAVTELRLALVTELEDQIPVPARLENWRNRPATTLEAGRDSLLVFAGQAREPGKGRAGLDEAALAELKRRVGESVKESLLAVEKLMSLVGETDTTIESIRRRVDAGGAWDVAMQGYRERGVSEVLGPAAVAIANAYAKAAFDVPTEEVRFLEDSTGRSILEKLGDDRKPARKFWSTQELKAEYRAAGIDESEAEIAATATLFQAVRLFSVLGNEVK